MLREQQKGEKKMLWKLVIKVLKCQRKNYLRAIKLGRDVFIIDIHRFIPAEKEIQKWKEALGKPKA